MTSQQIIDLINQQSGEVTINIINDILYMYTYDWLQCKDLWNRYSGDVPIKYRQFTDPNKVNNKLLNDYRGHIISLATGYFMGTPINYSFKENEYDDNQVELIRDEIEDFELRNSIDWQDSLVAEYTAVTGVGYRLLYIDTEGNERSIVIPPWEAIVIMDASLNEPAFGLRQWKLQDTDINSNVVWRQYVEFYDRENVWTFYESANNALSFIDCKPHMFSGCVPLIEYANNTLYKGDFEPVEALIDDYDKTLSDIANEREENTTLAFMVFKGIDALTDNERNELHKSRSMFLPKEDMTVDYLTKDIKTEYLENHKKTLDENIIKFSNTVNMSDEKFSSGGGAQSGESRKWKMLSLENMTKNKERNFTRALRYQYKTLCSAWNKKGLLLDYKDMTFTYTRSIPVEMLNAATINKDLFGMGVSDKFRLGLFPGITDVNEEMAQQAKEKQANDIIPLDKLFMKDQTPTLDINNNPVITNDGTGLPMMDTVTNVKQMYNNQTLV